MNQTYPKISIVTPFYNQGKYIEETTLSVIKQNYPDLEYIIIDDEALMKLLILSKKYEKNITY